ncbi:hypothetical protein MNBD_GAMMA23-2148 [hydrothermal vent metagenome]|uniref:Periplasmic divalent cation tolerance protein CutA n=1 Tax=hydrothermal vent metagenome TaxID=652676 RepID=A0A3B1B1I2_9ZZZZ
MTSLYYIALTTCPNIEVATSIAQGAVKQQLTACVNIIPNIHSVYQWQGEIETDNELLLVMKTEQQTLKTLELFIMQQHPYETPEFICMNIESGAQAYLDWITNSLKK